MSDILNKILARKTEEIRARAESGFFGGIESTVRTTGCDAGDSLLPCIAKLMLVKRRSSQK